MFWLLEKKGKTLHLLKASSKKINPNKKRKVVPLLGTIQDFFKASKSKPQVSQPSQMIVDSQKDDKSDK